MRNRIYTYHKYFYRLPLWMFKDVKYVFIEFLKIILVEKEKGAKIKMMILGVLDAIAGREGRYLEKGSLKK